jgi:hypothetical protein
MIFLMTQYRQQLKTVKPSTMTVRQWTPAAADMLSDCMEPMDLNVFRGACDGLDDFTDTVTSYINFVENSCIPLKSVVVFSNNKPLFNKEIKAQSHFYPLPLPPPPCFEGVRRRGRNGIGPKGPMACYFMDAFI